MNKEFIVLRDGNQPIPKATIGRLILNGLRFGYTLEDEDRKLEADGVKVYAQTAIPRGRYRLVVTYSNRFKKPLPLLLDVPQFEGIRIHGGNTEENTEGCILLGQERTGRGIRNCAERVQTLTKLIEDAEDEGIECWITVK